MSLGLDGRAELGSRLNLGFGFARRIDLWNGIEPGDGVVFGVRALIGVGPLLGHGSDHGGDGAFFEVGGGARRAGEGS